MNTALRTRGRVCSGLSLSCLLLACNSGIVVGVEDPGLGGTGPGAGAGAGATDYSQRPQPESWCWFISDNDPQPGVGDTLLYEVDMTTGEFGVRSYLAPHPDGGGVTMALHGRELIWETAWSMASFNVDTGVLRDPQFGTTAITSNGEELLAFCPWSDARFGLYGGESLCVYDDLDALWSLTESRTMPAPPDTLAFALGQDVLYGASFYGGAVSAYDKTSGDLLSTIELELEDGEGGWDDGIAVVGDRLLRVGLAEDSNIFISVHDIATGDATAKVSLGNSSDLGIFPGGLICGGTFD